MSATLSMSHANGGGVHIQYQAYAIVYYDIYLVVVYMCIHCLNNQLAASFTRLCSHCRCPGRSSSPRHGEYRDRRAVTRALRPRTRRGAGSSRGTQQRAADGEGRGAVVEASRGTDAEDGTCRFGVCFVCKMYCSW